MDNLTSIFNNAGAESEMSSIMFTDVAAGSANEACDAAKTFSGSLGSSTRPLVVRNPCSLKGLLSTTSFGLRLYFGNSTREQSTAASCVVL